MVAFPCPTCGAADARTIETRPARHGIYRRRTCMECKARFSTIETLPKKEGPGRKRKFSALLHLYRDLEVLLKEAGLLDAKPNQKTLIPDQ